MLEGDDIQVIEARPERPIPYLRKVWDYRAMMVSFARKDLKVKYSQTLLGVFWSALQPLTGLAIFTFFFGGLLGMEIPDGTPYALFAFSGLIAWNFFSYLVHSSRETLLANQEIIKKIYFPRMVLPLSKVLVGLVEFLISLVLFLVFALFFGVVPQWQILLFPLFILLNTLVGLSVSIWLSALTVRYRDFHHIIPYLINFGIWLTPVFYPATLLPSGYDWLLYLNPMSAVVAGYRWTLLGSASPSIFYALSFIPVLFLVILGIRFFIKIERDIADVL